MILIALGVIDYFVDAVSVPLFAYLILGVVWMFTQDD